jgi:hypothetical protein
VRPAVPSTLPAVASVRQIFAAGVVAVSATRFGVPGASLGKATPHETISLELSSTGLSFVSSDASAFRTDGVVGIFMSCLSVARGKARGCEPPLRGDSSYYALMPFIVLWTMTSPSVTFGGF